MQQTPIAGANFNRGNAQKVSAGNLRERTDLGGYGGGRKMNRECPVDIARAGGHFEGLRHPNDDIGPPELPFAGSYRRHRNRRDAIPLRCPGLRPSGQGCNLTCSQSALALEKTVRTAGQPWRHRPGARQSRDRSRTLRGLFVGLKREGRRAAGMMTFKAVGENNGRNLAPPSRRRGFLRMHFPDE